MYVARLDRRVGFAFLLFIYGIRAGHPILTRGLPRDTYLLTYFKDEPILVGKISGTKVNDKIEGGTI